MPFGFGQKPPPPPPPPPPSGRPAPPAVTFDKSNGIPEVSAALYQLSNGDWRSVEATHGQSRDWETRAAVSQALAELDPSDEWIRSCPHSSFAYSVLAVQLRRMAWAIRGNGMASSVPQDAWASFFEMLGQSERASRAAAELAPDDPYPWAQLITTGTGLEVSKDEIMQRFNAMWARDPNHIYGWFAVIPSLSKKWGGSDELMFNVARHGDRYLPPGSVARVAIVSAHEEKRLYLSAFEQDREAAKAYFKLPDVVTEISNAATNSVFSDQFRPSAVTRIVQSWFAYGLALAGDALPGERIRAANLFNQLGTHGIPGSPWTTRYGSKAGEQYARIRELCYRSAGVADLH